MQRKALYTSGILGLYDSFLPYFLRVFLSLIPDQFIFLEDGGASQRPKIASSMQHLHLECEVYRGE